MELSEARLAEFQCDFARLQKSLEEVIVGQTDLVRDLLCVVLAGGHVLLEGPPGLGKTYLVKALANLCGLSMSRIQCTPDLMPADITGSEILVQSASGDVGRLEFRPGPVFSSLVLVDEVNRATPRTQAALLEAMQERQVTCAGGHHSLPSPFWVLATQNPIEFEGTYPLPEAQLDRFMAKLSVGYPSHEALGELVARTLDGEPADALVPLVDAARLQDLMSQATSVVLSAAVVDAAARLVLATHPAAGGLAREHLRYGASPRALQSLLRLARVRALAAGRGHVSFDDLVRCALPVLRHRVLLAMDSELAGVDVDAILTEVRDEWAAHF